MRSFPRPRKYGLLLEAEVSPTSQSRFEKRYHAATGVAVTPGTPAHYQDQPNKWGAELRIYFKSPGMAISLQAHCVHVEYRRTGYKAGEYCYRANDNKLWWKLVEVYDLRLGEN
jgi:hypothetical protein